MDKTILNHFKNVDPVLYSYAVQITLSDDTVIPDLFETLCESIVSQQLSEKAGSTIWGRFKKLFHDKQIKPADIQKVDVEFLRQSGISRPKATYIKDLASRIILGEVELDKFDQLENEIIIAELVKVKGIGPWTAEMFLMFALKRPDVFSAGDLGLRRAIQKIYRLDHEPSVEEMLTLSDKWSPYRTYASRVLWRSLAL